MTTRCGIYLVKHSQTGRSYVGQSIDIDRRLRGHAKGRSGDGILCHAIAKHGWDAFETSVLELCSRDRLNLVEVEWIARLKTLHPDGFNLTTGGEQYAFSEATRALISERTRAGLTPEICAQRGAKLRGVPKSADHKAKMRDAALRNEENLERLRKMAQNQSPETRKRISLATTGKKKTLTAEQRAAAAERKRSPENLARLLKMVQNFSAETRAKMSASAKARWAGRERGPDGRFP